jgi:hypothetical protein
VVTVSGELAGILIIYLIAEEKLRSQRNGFSNLQSIQSCLQDNEVPL